MVRTTRTPIPGLPGVVLTATQQQGSTTFALDVTRDDCVDFTLDLSGNDCEVVDAEGALHLRAIASKGTTALGAAVGPTPRLVFEYAIKSLRPSSPQTVVEDVVENDSEMRTILKDVRTRINDYADKNEAKLMRDRPPSVADLEAEGTLYVLLLRGTGLLAKDANRASNGILQLIEPLALTSERCCGG